MEYTIPYLTVDGVQEKTFDNAEDAIAFVAERMSDHHVPEMQE